MIIDREFFGGLPTLWLSFIFNFYMPMKLTPLLQLYLPPVRPNSQRRGEEHRAGPPPPPMAVPPNKGESPGAPPDRWAPASLRFPRSAAANRGVWWCGVRSTLELLGTGTLNASRTIRRRPHNPRPKRKRPLIAQLLLTGSARGPGTNLVCFG